LIQEDNMSIGIRVTGTLLVALAGFASPGFAQIGDGGPSGISSAGTPAREPLLFRQSDWSGPRLGFMCAPGDPAITERLRSHGLGPIVSQFGWHFERRIAPFGNGPEFVTEFVPLLGGFEYGKLLPSLSLAIGFRNAAGWEFGMGPSLTLSGAHNEPGTGLILAAGRSLDYGEIRVPVHLAVSTNPRGTMLTLLVGYAIHQPRR
jgi:hypothetical protein